MIRNTYNGQTFIRCDCGYYDRIGIPCAHILCLVEGISVNMFHIHHWKVYNVHYDDKSGLGSLMIQDQIGTD